MLLYCITLSSSRENQRSAQEVARRISGAVAWEIRAKSSQDLISCQRAISGAIAGSTQVKTYQIPITNSSPSHYIICHLPLVFLSPTSPFLYYPSLFRSPLFRLPLVCLCVGLFVTMAQDNTKLCDFSNTNNKDFPSTRLVGVLA